MSLYLKISEALFIIFILKTVLGALLAVQVRILLNAVLGLVLFTSVLSAS